mgnify:CR=1 FL=1
MDDMDLINVRKKYIVAVSGGPDSMALLHMCITEKLDICVAHVNYRKRQSAFVEMEEVEKYCKQNNIPFSTHSFGIKVLCFLFRKISFQVKEYKHLNF